MTLISIHSSENLEVRCREVALPHMPKDTLPCRHQWQSVAPFGLVQKQVQFNLGNDSGGALSLPTDLANFLEGNAANEQNDAPHPLVPSTTGSPELPCDDGHQPTLPAQEQLTPKLLSSPWPSFGPNPGPEGCPTHWIRLTTGFRSQAGRHPWWWKEL